LPFLLSPFGDKSHKGCEPGVAAGTRYAAEQMAHLDSEKPAKAS
jgi:hypothetical protein